MTLLTYEQLPRKVQKHFDTYGINTAAEAKAKNLRVYYTGKPCKHGHIELRETEGSKCPACKLINNRNYYHANDGAKRSRMKRIGQHSGAYMEAMTDKDIKRYAKRYEDADSYDAVSVWTKAANAVANAIRNTGNNGANT